MTKQISVIKLKLQINTEIKYKLDGQSRICNWLYNTLLENANELKKDFIENQNSKSCKTLYTKYGLRNIIPKLKLENKFLKVVHSSPLKNSALRLTKSIKSYQDSRKGRCGGQKRGWPKFRSWRRDWFSLFYDEPNKGFKIVGSNLNLSFGLANDRENRNLIIPMQDSYALKGKIIKNCQICKTGSDYYAVFNVENDYPKPKEVTKIIAFDPNHKNLLYGVDNLGNAIEVSAPKWLKIFDKRIDELKSKRDSCKRKSKIMEVLDYEGKPIGKKRWQPSKRWQKYDCVLQRVYDNRREQIKTYCYTLANSICSQYDLISLGDYTPNGGGITRKMRRAMNNRSVIGRFKEVLSWVAFKSGKSYMEYTEKGTTRTCHNCKTKILGGLNPDIRQWKCSSCEIEHHRDENAAINGLIKTFAAKPDIAQNSANIKVPGSGPVISIDKRWAWSVLPRGVVITTRGENCGQTVNSRKLNGQCGNCLPNMIKSI